MDLLTQRLDAHGRALELLARRQQVLAANIANADTPGYQARDIDFAATLAQAQGGPNAPGRLVATATRHLQPHGGAPQADLLYRQAEQPALDGNTVDLDRERASFADNALRYEATVRFINSNVRTMLSAITGQ
ncbi:flagellar basal body rod protein FlgB [Ramlibacter sp. AW1]|uniref:Flagellar basal body rod protein FlgB n=1 Tax=Ramlibacter aurantiacus TaxID=2801330 RepID=A0A936ZL57_9BURK|nr:flagellar basal body rod protein FlgB [Ramlibacter aurantiacus]MBL0423324.1 flagellar basal body rod protein FlgB [Ramlibacter aurantiacus]